jgi:hypothetical protein
MRNVPPATRRALGYVPHLDSTVVQERVDPLAAQGWS